MAFTSTVKAVLVNATVKAISGKGLNSELFDYGMLMLIDMQTHKCVPNHKLSEFHTVIWT